MGSPALKWGNFFTHGPLLAPKLLLPVESVPQTYTILKSFVASAAIVFWAGQRSTQNHLIICFLLSMEASENTTKSQVFRPHVLPEASSTAWTGDSIALALLVAYAGHGCTQGICQSQLHLHIFFLFSRQLTTNSMDVELNDCLTNS